jgi:hypothetical protein
MAVAFVQGNKTDPGGAVSSVTVSLPSNTAGNLLVVAVEIPVDSKVSITDTASNIWQTGFLQNYNPGNWGMRLFYAENCKASSGTNTVTINANASQYMRIAMAEYSGVATSLSYSNGAQATDSLSTGSFAVTSGDLIVAVGFSLNGDLAAGTGLTSRETFGYMMLADGIASSGSFNATMTGTGFQTILAVAFHASPAPDQGLYKGGDYSGSTGPAGTYSESAVFLSNTANDTLIAFVEVSNTNVLNCSISDTAGNTWTLLDTVASGTAWIQGVFGVSNCNASSGKNVVTATFTLSVPGFVRLWISEYGTTPITSHATGISTSTTVDCLLSTTNGALIVAACMCTNSSCSPGGGYLSHKTDTFMELENGIATGSTATPSFSIASGGATIIALSIGSGGFSAQPFIWFLF